MASFQEVADTKHASYIDALNDRVLQEARLRVRLAEITALEIEDRTIRELGFDHTSALQASYPALLIGHDLAIARRNLVDIQSTADWSIATAERYEADDTAHFREHTEEYYEWALELAHAAGKEIKLSTIPETVLQPA